MAQSPDKTDVSENCRTYAADGGTDAEKTDDRETGAGTDSPSKPRAENVDDLETGNVGFDSDSDDWMDGDDEWDGSSVSRRGMVGYLGGTMLGVFGLAGAAWFAFIREPTEPEEQVVIDYWDYIDRAQYYSAVAIFHRNAPANPPSAETVAIYSRASIDVADTEILDRREDVDLDGVAVLALVRAEIEIDWGTSVETMRPAFAVVQNEDGDWRMWDDGRNNDNEY